MSQNHKHPTLGVFLAITSSLLFGLNASTTKILIESGISAEQLVLFRSAAVALFAAIGVALTNPKAFKLQLREIPFFALFGVVGVGLMQWAYSNAVANLQVGVALLIEYTAIVIVPVASYFLFKERDRISGLILVGMAAGFLPWLAILDRKSVV